MASTVSPGANCSSRNTPIRIRNRVGIEAARRRPARPSMRICLSIAFSTDVGTGSREENASNKEQERSEGERQAESQRSCQLEEPQRGVLEWLRALAVITVTKICSIGIQTGSSVFTSLTNSA